MGLDAVEIIISVEDLDAHFVKDLGVGQGEGNMDIESRRVALFVALIQVMVSFGVFAPYCIVENRTSLLIPLILFLVPVIWLTLVFYLQEKGNGRLLAIVFYSSFPYMVFLLIWFLKLFAHFMYHVGY